MLLGGPAWPACRASRPSREPAHRDSIATETTSEGSLSTNAETIASFYQAFQERDHVAMAACYHEDVHFSDPVFPNLRGDEARAMWHMLCDRGTDLRVTFEDVTAEGDRGAAHWEARYTFSPTMRLVHNRVEASFVFQDGKILRHVDQFDLWRWTRMALGTTGTLTGWSGPAQSKVRKTAAHGLQRFMAEHPEYGPDGG
jgi:ketosteroid isomerase-like protein